MGKEKVLTPRSKDYSAWYSDVITAADLAEHAITKGCMVIKPYGYSIWENIQSVLDATFKKTGVKNAYFPLLIPKKLLDKEKSHVKGFSPELAVVTHGGGKKLEEPLIVRPTSETIIYDSFAKWINSWRDLPLLINQWANVVRWEMRTRLFLRTTEFLWQEGHTAHATADEAEAKTREMLSVYAQFAEDYLAMPVIAGEKTASERFAGALRTYAIEAMMQDGKALQAGTSHNLGINFAKAFDIKYSDKSNKLQYVWQTSWGVSTRIIGGLIMSHSDDHGLVLPPKIAPVAVVVVPIKTDPKALDAVSEAVGDLLAINNLRMHIDRRDHLTPGAKFNEWEKKGVPLRIEIGPRDLESGTAVIARRDQNKKVSVPFSKLATHIPALLETMQQELLQKARALRDEHSKLVTTYDELKKQINGGFAYAYWDGDAKTEAKGKEETKATIRCIPFAWPYDDGDLSDKKDPVSGHAATYKVVYAKTY